MSPERWKRINELFEQAAGRGPQQVRTFLEQACGSDARLREEVESLLAADAIHPSFLQGPVERLSGDDSAAAAKSRAPALRALAGTRVGAFRLERRIAAGGMGEVWLAERDDRQFAQRAAVKLVRPGLDAADLLNRFRHERQVLANLAHPNIARLLDGGAAEDGSPFIAMEYIEGVPIDRYCDSQRLTIRQRLELFRQVCGAVQFAHANLVVHRDLKPGNILVAADGTPKLLDFGIAKVFDPRRGLDAGLTLTGQRLMTPEYASPEQVLGRPITTSTDVYSLGVVLYELLTGRRPYSPADESLAACEKAICDQEPTAPSTAVTRDGPIRAGGDTADIAARRGAEPSRLRRVLAGDLDNIVLMALRKEPARRYASVEQFSEDIRRHLDGLPVTARPDTFGYRAGKFLKRHAGAVAAVAVLFTVITVSAALLARQAGRLQAKQTELIGANTKAADQAANALRQKGRAERISIFLKNMLESIDPNVARGRDTAVIEEMLAAAAREVDAELSAQPDVQAELHETIGRTYQVINRFDPAEDHLRRSVEARRVLAPPDPLALASSLNSLGLLLADRGRDAEARAAYQEALDLRSRHDEADSRANAVTMDNYAGLLQTAGELSAATELREKALEILRRKLGNDHDDVAAALNNQAMLYLRFGDAARAEEILNEVLRIRRRLYHPEHSKITVPLANLAEVLRHKGDFAAALVRAREVLDIYQRIYPSDHSQVANALNNVAILHSALGDHREALRHYRESLKIRRALFGEDHDDIAVSLSNVAGELMELGDYAGAVDHYRRAHELFRRRRGDSNADYAQVSNNLAHALMESGQYDEAESLYREALPLLKKHLGDKHDHVAVVQSNLGEILLRRGGPTPEAETLLRAGVETGIAALGEDHPRVATLKSNLAEFFLSRGEFEEAEKLVRQAMDVERLAFGEESEQYSLRLETLGKILREQKKFDEAIPLYRESLRTRKAALGADNRGVAALLNNLGNFYREAGLLDDAEACIRESLATITRLAGERHPNTAAVKNTLARLLEARGRLEDAEPYYADCASILRETLPTDHPNVRGAIENHASTLRSLGRLVEAVGLYRESLNIRTKVFGEGDPQTAFAHQRLGECLHESGEFAEAVEHLEAARGIYRAAGASRRTSVLICTDRLAQVALDRGDAGDGLRLARETLSLAAEFLPADDPGIAQALLGVARALTALKKPEEAEPLLRRALEIRIRTPGLKAGLVAQAQCRLGICLLDLQKNDEAEPLLQEGFEGVKSAAGLKHPETMAIAGRLAEFYEKSGRSDKAAELRSQIPDQPAPTTQAAANR